MPAECVEEKKNIGKSRCNKLPKLFKYAIWTPNDFVLEEADLATGTALRTALQDALKETANERIYLFPKFSGSPTENASEATIYIESALGSRKARDGNYRFRHFISKSMCAHRAMFTHSTSEGRFIYVDVENQMLLTKDSDGNYRGLSIDLLNLEKLKLSSGDDLTESPIYVALADNREVDESGYVFDIGTVISELEPLTDVDLTLDEDFVITATEFVVHVNNSCDGTPISGLVLADFAVTNAAGAAQVPTSVTEPNNDGVYHIIKSTNFVDGFVTLVAPSALTIDAYESTGAVAVNIP